LQIEILLDIGPDMRPGAAMTDKAHDAKADRQAARERGFCPVIPYRYPAGKQPGTTPLSSRSPAASFSSNPSARLNGASVP
jgi:hypothetical protein